MAACLVTSIVIAVRVTTLSPGWRFLATTAIVLVAVGSVTAVGLRGIVGSAKARDIVIGMCISGAALVGALLASEAAVRLLYHDLTTTAGYSFFIERWLRQHPPALNSYGFRDGDIPARTPGTLRVAVIGDSFTYGWGLDVEDRMTEQLQSMIDISGVRIMNFGRPAASTRDELEILREAVLPLAPDFVLLQWYVNDGEFRSAPRSMLPRPLLPSAYLNDFLIPRSALYYLATRTWIRLQVRLGWTPAYAEIAETRFGDPRSAEADTAQAAIEEFIKAVDSAGLPLGVVMFPRIEEVAEAADYSLGFLIERVLRTCTATSTDCIDMRPLFAVHDVERLRLNTFDAHPSREANHIAARAVLDRFHDDWARLVGPSEATVERAATPGRASH